MPDLSRWLVAAEMLTLLISLVAVVALYDTAARRAPSAWRWATGGVALILVGGTFAVVLNAFLAGPQTPGVRALVYIAGLAAVLGIIAVVVGVRRQPVTEAQHREAHVVANAPLLAEALSHLQHLEPCPNPDCVVVRVQLRALAGDAPSPT